MWVIVSLYQPLEEADRKSLSSSHASLPDGSEMLTVDVSEFHVSKARDSGVLIHEDSQEVCFLSHPSTLYND